MNTEELGDGSRKISGRAMHNLTVYSTITVLSGLLITVVYYTVSANQAKIDVRKGFDSLSRGDVDQAISKFKKAVAADKQAIYKFTNTNYNDTPEEALQKLALQLKLRADNDYALEQQAEAYENAKQLAKAERSYRIAIALKVGDFTPGMAVYSTYEDLPAKYARLLIKEGKKAEAVKFVERNRPVLFFNEEFDALCKELKLPKRDFSMRKEASEEIRDVLWQVDSDISDSEQLPNALKNLDKLIAKYPWCDQALLMKAKANIELHPDTAIDCANRILAKHPGLAEALHIRGKAHNAKHEYPQAIDDFTAALKELPDTSQYYIEMSDVHLANGMWKEALSDLDRAERVAKPISDVVDKRAEILECVGDKSAAIREFTKALHCAEILELDGMWNKQSGDTSFNDSYSYWSASSSQMKLLLAEGKLDEAEKVADGLRANQFQDYRLRIAKSQIRLLRNDNAGALAAAMEAKGLESDDAKQSDESLVQLASVHDAMGQPELARRELQSALQIVNGRLNEKDDKDACACNNNYFERALIGVRLGAPLEDLRRDVRLALKQKGMTVLEVGRFMSELKMIKRTDTTNAVAREILTVHPYWKSLVEKWLRNG